MMAAPYDQDAEATPRPAAFDEVTALKAANAQLERQVVVLQRRLTVAEETISWERSSRARRLAAR